MRKLLLTILFVLLCSSAHAATTWYACTANGNWSSATEWTSVSADQGTCAASLGTPVAGDTAILNSSSGNITITSAAAAATLTESGYTGTLAFGAQTLTLTAGATLSGAMTSSSGTLTITGGGVTLASTPTGSFPTIKLTTNSQFLTSGGFNWPGNINFDLAGIFTFTGNWYTGGLTTLSLTPMTWNHTTTETYTAAGGLSGNAAITGSLTQLYLEGGTWTTGGAQPIEVPMTITPSVSNITLSGIVSFGGTSNTLTYTASTGTVTTTGSTLELPSVTTALTLSTSGLTFNNIYFLNYTATVNLPSTFTINGTLTFWANTITLAGTTTINCANFTVAGSGTSTTLALTIPAGTTVNVTNSLSLVGSFSYTGVNGPILIKSGTVSSPIYINYTGLSGNAVVSNISFTDVQFTGLSVYDYSQSSNQPTLLRSTGLTIVSPLNITTSAGTAG